MIRPTYREVRVSRPNSYIKEMLRQNILFKAFQEEVLSTFLNAEPEL